MLTKSTWIVSAFSEKTSLDTLYRYRTLVFGLTASPFILNYIIKHHLANYESDSTNEILTNNLYVDNLLFTGNDAGTLKTACDVGQCRMAAGGFELRSWFSNDASLQNKFKDCNIGTLHECDAEKVLGYRYFPYSDELSIAELPDQQTTVVTN